MNEQNRKNKKSQNKSGVLAPLAILLIALLRNLGNDNDGAAAVIFGILVLFGAFYLVFTLSKKTAEKRRAAAKPETYTPKTPSVALHRPAPSMERPQKIASYAHPQPRSFPEPDPYCVVCENTGLDHFERDRQQRLRQLDDWLKNGLIDREEYRILKERYARE